VDFFHNKYSRDDELLLIEDLLTEENINLVLRTKHTDQTFAFIHNHCLSLIPKPARFRENGLSWQVSFLLRLLETMRQKRLPKEWQPGLVLLYFKLCEGVEIPVATRS